MAEHCPQPNCVEIRVNGPADENRNYAIHGHMEDGDSIREVLQRATQSLLERLPE